MSDRDELARVVGEAIVTNLHKGGYASYGTSELDAVIDGEIDLPDVADAILAAGYRKPKAVDHRKMWIENGWLVAETGRHDCAGGDGAASYHHEPTCGIEPLDNLTEVLERSGYRKCEN